MCSPHQYQSLQDALAGLSAEMGAAEAHGLLCGMFCGPGETQQARWMAHVLEGTEPRGECARYCLARLAELYERTREAFESQELAFSLLLPDDDLPVDERGAALGKWCEGFLFGLSVGGLTNNPDLPREACEIIRDLGEIARIDAGMNADEDSEAAYAELVEYVRMGTLLLLEHVAALPKQHTKAPRSRLERRLH